MGLVKINTDKLAEYQEQTAMIQRQAFDLVNEPIVQEGYKRSGKPAAMVFMNVTAMALARIKRYYPMASAKDPLYMRLLNEIKYICADCIRQKYICREERIPFNHTKEINRRVAYLMENEFAAMQLEFVKLTETT